MNSHALFMHEKNKISCELKLFVATVNFVTNNKYSLAHKILEQMQNKI